VRIIARISASAFHGSIDSSACPSQTYEVSWTNVTGCAATVEER
jgi:hypothetical protein